ncbi:hypothetical protein AB0I53_39450 [Saccharopolyspora sp. NPDC050389]
MEAHVEHVLAKLGFTSRSQAALFAAMSTEEHQR